jgi:polyisoprenoid-binding protein YceI
MKRPVLLAGGLVAFVVLAFAAIVVVQLIRSDDPDLATEAPQITPAAGTTPGLGTDAPPAAAAGGARRFVIVPGESSAKYVVEETLRGIVTNAVGQTQNITGEIYLTSQGLSTEHESKFRVDLRTLRSDESMRDNFIRQTTLQTNRFPFAEFVVQELRGFPSSYVENQQVELTLTGTMTIRGVSRPMTWTVLARQAGNTLTATADTGFNMTDYGIDPPNVAVARARDGVQLQIVLVAREP